MKPVRTKRKDGSVVWLVRWRERGRDSARRSKAFSNKANAEKWITHLRNQKELGQLATASTIPLAELACIYVEQHLPGLATRPRHRAPHPPPPRRPRAPQHQPHGRRELPPRPRARWR